MNLDETVNSEIMKIKSFTNRSREKADWQKRLKRFVAKPFPTKYSKRIDQEGLSITTFERDTYYQALSTRANYCMPDEIKEGAVGLLLAGLGDFGNYKVDSRLVKVNGVALTAAYLTSYFLENLINKSPENEIVIPLKSIPEGSREPKLSIGRRNQNKKLIISGSVGSIGDEMSGGEIYLLGDTFFAGNDLTGGRITIYGEVNGRIGSDMSGGEVYMYGNTEAHVGNNQSGGSIYIDGNVRYAIGMDLTGGTISVNGKRPFLSRKMTGGNVYHNGKQIVRDGKKIDAIHILEEFNSND